METHLIWSGLFLSCVIFFQINGTEFPPVYHIIYTEACTTYQWNVTSGGVVTLSSGQGSVCSKDPFGTGVRPAYNGRANCTIHSTSGSIGVTVTFCFYNITTTDSGVYQVTTGGQIRNGTVFVMDNPTFPQISPTTAEVGRQETLICTSTSTSTPSPTAQAMYYTWTVNNTAISDPRFSTSSNTLTINTVRKEDKYNLFQCTARENQGLSSNTAGILLTVRYPPQGKPVMSYSTLTYLTGNTVTLSCSITEDGNPLAKWTWRCGSRTFNSGITNSVGLSNLTYVVTKTDNNQPCTCTAASSVGSYSQISDPVTLNILYPPQSRPVMSFSTLTYLAGSSVTLSCSITEDGNPQATWTWRCGSRTFNNGITNSVGRSNLRFVVTKTDNNQPCTCTASSSVGPYSQISDPATLEIRFETTTTLPPVPQRSDISCNADTIDTFVPISMLPSGAPLTWRDPSCKVTSNGTHMISSIGHNQCGTTVTITKDTVEFENELTAQISNHSSNTLIDFGENSYVIPVKCIYPRTETPMTSYVPLQQHVRFYEKRYGHFDVDITQYDSDKFSSAIQGLGVPRKVALNAEIFVEVKMNDQFNNGLGIHVDKCIATPSPSPSDSTYYNLLTDGCPASQHVQLYNAPANKVRFGVRAFQFTSHNSSIVYIHCQTSMCEVGTPYCVSNCVTAGRRKRDVAPDQKSHLVSTGPFVFVADEQDNPIRMSTIVASVSLFVAVVACVAAVMGWTRKNTHKCTKEEGLL